MVDIWTTVAGGEEDVAWRREETEYENELQVVEGIRRMHCEMVC